MARFSYTQDSFDGGMNLVSQGTKVRSNEYILGINVRTRFGAAEPINGAVDITEDLPVSNRTIQGVYAFGEILIAFVGGLAYYRNIGSLDDEWTQVADFSMSVNASRIYAQGIPANDLLYLRKNNSGSSPNAGVIFDPASATGTSEIALVCQDGVNQPWLIFANGTARVSKTYTQWSVDQREYIPIGKQMAYSNGILYVVSADGKRIYRSVSGRPTDFVIAVDSTGAKIADVEPVSIAVDNNEIKLMAAVNTGDIIIITAYNAYMLTPDFDNTIYGEPRFDQVFLFTAGTINQFCWADLLGDFAFVDREGLKSFNAVKQLKFEGNNSVFSIGVAKLFKNIVQDDNVCVGSFDNYIFFSVKTTYSPSSIVVYDVIKKVFCSIDLPVTNRIKQFATTYSASRQRFFGITDHEVFELYSPDEDYLTPVIYTRELDSRNADNFLSDGVYDIKASSLRLIFEDSPSDGIVYVDELVNNNRSGAGYERNIPAYSTGISYPVLFPVMFTVNNSITPIDIPKFSKKEGQKLGYVITWTGGAKLNYFIARCEGAGSPVSIQQKTRVNS